MTQRQAIWRQLLGQRVCWWMSLLAVGLFATTVVMSVNTLSRGVHRVPATQSGNDLSDPRKLHTLRRAGFAGKALQPAGQ